jgi:hypothetical protein
MFLKNIYNVSILFLFYSINAADPNQSYQSFQNSEESKQQSPDFNNQDLISPEQSYNSKRIFDLSRQLWINSLQIKSISKENLNLLFPNYSEALDKRFFTRSQNEFIVQQFGTYFKKRMSNIRPNYNVYNQYIESHGLLICEVTNGNENRLGNPEVWNLLAITNPNCFKNLTDEQTTVIGCLSTISLSKKWYSLSKTIYYQDIIDTLKHSDLNVTYEYLDTLMNTFQPNDYAILVNVFNLKKRGDCYCCTIQ